MTPEQAREWLVKDRDMNAREAQHLRGRSGQPPLVQRIVMNCERHVASLTVAISALDAVARVRALHKIDKGRDPWSGEPYCVCAQCGRQDYDASDCPTIRALDGKVT